MERRRPLPPAQRREPARLLVTGAAGFVGSRLVRAAVDRGYEVVAAVRRDAGADHLGRLPSVRVIEIDLFEPATMRRAAAAAAPDVAVHLAWPIGADCYDSPDNLASVGGSLALLRGLVDAGCRRVVCVGSHLELAPHGGDMREDDPVAPQNLYAVCKDAVHRVARRYLEGASTALVWARLFNVYGPGQADWALVSHVARRLLEGRRCPMTHGAQERTFLHVADVAEALLDVAGSSLAGVAHVGGDEVVTVRELASRIGEHLGRSELLSFGALEPAARDAPRIVPSTTRLRSEVGFQPRWKLDEGLADTLDWWRAQLAAAVAT